jgi:ABC-2 type transport system ATP-binding protein
MSSMQDAAIFAQGVHKRYRKTHAVRDVELSLPPGCVCGLVGPNGAGKTTTISMLLGLIKPTAGRLSILGIDSTRDSFQVRQRVGYVPERHFIYQWMKIPQVLSFARMIYPTWNRTECKRLVDLLQLPLKRRVKELSRGELAKLALTLALAHEPRVLILDEPTSGLDPIIRRSFLDTIAELIHQRDCTVLFSTHILSDAERIADRVVIMNHGRIIADESLDATRNRYIKASLLFPAVTNGDIVIPEAIRIHRAMREWVVIFPAIGEERVREIARGVGAMDCMIQPVSLDDAFFEMIGASNSELSQSAPAPQPEPQLAPPGAIPA